MINRVAAEAARCETKWGPYHSTHEGLGVLVEEYRELKDAIHDNDAEAIVREAIHVAATATRIAECLSVPASRERSGVAPARSRGGPRFASGIEGEDSMD